MYLSLKHLVLVRRLAGVAFALCYVLAASRVFTPALCLTLQESSRAAACAAACTVGPISPCCVHLGAPPESDSEPTPLTPGHSPNCALCHLAKALTEPLAFYQYPLSMEQAAVPYLRHTGDYHSRDMSDVSQGRAPPVA